MSISLDAANALEAAIDGKIANSAKPETRATATVTRIGSDKTAFVVLDGAESETPTEGAAAEVKPGDRVTVTVTGGKAYIEGNYTDPAAAGSTMAATAGEVQRVGSIVADEISAARARFGHLEADTAYIRELKADNITAQDIAADHATVNTLDANYARINGANITTATIRDAWIDKLMVQSGLIAHEGTVYELDAIQVNASKIKAGTLDVERLVVTQDGQKYLVHVNAQGTATYEKLDGNIIEDLTITADKIVAGAITAQKITTENIVGSGGWINLRNGTFNYTNATTGDGIAWDGQHLTINAASIDAKVSKDGVIAAINLSTEQSGGSAVKINADKVNIEGAAIFTSGRLSQTSLDGAYDANGAATTAVDNLKTDLASSSGTTVIDGGHITTGSIAIGTLDSSTQTKIANGNTAANKLTTTLAPLTGSIGNVSGVHYVEICKSTIACNSNSASGAVNISGTIGGYVNTNQGRVNVTIGTRGTPPYAIVGQRDSTIDTTRGNIVAYYDSNYIVHVYLVMSATYSKYVLNLSDVSQFSRVGTTTTTAPSGTKFFDLSEATTEDSRTATNYITADSSGIKIHNANDSTDYVQITSDGMDVYNDGENVARFGSDGAQIGKDDTEHVTIEPSGLSVYDSHGLRAFSVDMATLASSAKHIDGYISPTHMPTVGVWFNDRTSQWVSVAETSYSYYTISERVPSNPVGLDVGGDLDVILQVNSTDMTASFVIGTPSSYNVVKNSITYATLTYDGQKSVTLTAVESIEPGSSEWQAIITAVYADLLYYGSAVTFGTTPEDARIGDFSSRFGVNVSASGGAAHAQNVGTMASSDYQTAIGKYNLEDTNDEYALIVGNGSDDSNRSNALAVTWDGDIVTPGAVNLANTLTTDTFTKSYTAAANSGSGAVDITITKTGYTPLGIVQCASGSQSVAIVQYSLLNDTTARCYFRNVSGSAASPTCNIKVLYMAVV